MNTLFSLVSSMASLAPSSSHFFLAPAQSALLLTTLKHDVPNCTYPPGQAATKHETSLYKHSHYTLRIANN